MDALIEVLRHHPKVNLAILFGSLASDTARADSDLDLAISGPYPLTAADKSALIADLAAAIGRPVDLIDLDHVGEPLLGQILRHGRRILGSDVQYANLLRRHLFDMADFDPYRRRILEQRRNAWIGG